MRETFDVPDFVQSQSQQIVAACGIAACGSDQSPIRSCNVFRIFVWCRIDEPARSRGVAVENDGTPLSLAQCKARKIGNRDRNFLKRDWRTFRVGTLPDCDCGLED